MQLLALIMQEAADGGSVQLDPVLAAMASAIAALFAYTTWLARGRIERCEKREDSMLTADAERTSTLRELAAASAKSADVTADAVVAGTGAIDESRRNGAKLDDIARTMAAHSQNDADLRRSVDELRNSIDRLAGLNPPPSRRRPSGS